MHMQDRTILDPATVCFLLLSLTISLRLTDPITAFLSNRHAGGRQSDGTSGEKVQPITAINAN